MSGDTIFALATAPGRAAVAVVRVSGSDAGGAVRSLTGKAPPAARRASVRGLKSETGDLIDEGLVLWFEGPASYTGEDSAEFHVHGGTAVVDALMGALLAQGLRPAEPGEFTRRAFENGKLDLAQAEGVADLIDAQTTAQAKQALAQLGGALSDRHEAWRGALTEALAMLEAAVDFPDEELPANVAARARPPLERLSSELAAAASESDRGQRVREGFRIALIGAPNAGKSSLLNALAGRDAAIVTEIAGTTRDVIEVPIEIAGYRVLLADTAGLRDSRDIVEAEGVRRARAWAEQADLRLLVTESDTPPEGREGDLTIYSKADLRATRGDGLAVSVVSGAGLAELLDALKARVVEALQGAEFPAVTRARHARELADARDHLARAIAQLEESPEFAAEDVRLAARALGRITGCIGAEDVLDLVFGQFCIGK